MLAAALLATALCVSWIWNKADALTPVALPSAEGTPLETIDPSAKPTPTPDPVGRYVGSFMVASNNDKMPGMSSAWTEYFNPIGLYGGVGLWLTVHDKYDGKNSWGNVVAFGGLPKRVQYTATPAGLRKAAGDVGGILVTRLYPDNPVPTNIVHRPITVNGHRGHEITARIPVKPQPKLKETHSLIGIAVVDRGDGTAMVSIADVAGSTPQWMTVWKQRVTKMTFS